MTSVSTLIQFKTGDGKGKDAVRFAVKIPDTQKVNLLSEDVQPCTGTVGSILKKD